MTGETKTVALVATTLGMATVVALAAVISATASRADGDAPKILDRISETRPSIGLPMPKPDTPAFVLIADVDGTVVFRADPARRETQIAQGVPQIADRVPVPVARSEALLGLTMALAMPLPRPGDAPYRSGMPLPRPDVEVGAVSDRPVGVIRISDASFAAATAQ